MLIRPVLTRLKAHAINIRTYRDAFPLVALTLEEGGTMDLVDDLRDERIDVAFVRTAVTDLEGLV